MSPEQARSDPVDRRTDLFSLGSTLYAMCTGQAPFKASSPLAVIRKVSDEHPKPIAALSPETPNWLIVIIGKLQAKDPDDRFQSAIEVAALLSRHLAELQQPAMAPTPSHRKPLSMPKGTNRARTVSLASLSAVVVAFAALAIAVPLWNRESSTRELKVAGAESERPVLHIESQSPASSPGNSERAASLIRQAGEALARNDSPRAIEFYTEAIRLDPNNAGAHEMRGWLYLGMRDYQRAISDFTEALRIEPNRTKAYSGRGTTYLILNDLDAAIADFSVVIRATPEDFATLAQRADAYQRKGDYALAITDQTQAIKLDPRNVRLHGQRALAYCWASEPDQAIRDLDVALKLNPENSYRAYLIHLRGWAHALKKDWNGAIADDTQTLQIQPRNDYSSLFALLGRANCYAVTGRFELAEPDYDELIRLNQLMERHARSQRAYYTHLGAEISTGLLPIATRRSGLSLIMWRRISFGAWRPDAKGSRTERSPTSIARLLSTNRMTGRS